MGRMCVNGQVLLYTTFRQRVISLSYLFNSFMLILPLQYVFNLTDYFSYTSLLAFSDHNLKDYQLKNM